MLVCFAQRLCSFDLNNAVIEDMFLELSITAHKNWLIGPVLFVAMWLVECLKSVGLWKDGYRHPFRFVVTVLSPRSSTASPTCVGMSATALQARSCSSIESLSVVTFCSLVVLLRDAGRLLRKIRLRALVPCLSSTIHGFGSIFQ